LKYPLVELGDIATVPDPPGETEAVNRYSVWKLAVKLSGEAPTVIECEAAPPSLQFEKKYSVPTDPACGLATAMVWEPCARFKVCGAVCAAPPSTLNCSPDGFV
jgi:hypothetical protein